MKKLIALAITVAASYAGYTQTTQTEYDYLKKGLKITEESGLDIKQGYTLKDEGKIERGNYIFHIRTLRRSGTNAFVGTSIKISYKNNSYLPTWLALPAMKVKEVESIGWSEFYADLRMLNKEQLQELTFIMSSFSSYYESSKK